MKNSCLRHLLTFSYPSCQNSDVLKKMLISLPVQNGPHNRVLFFALNGLFGDGTISFIFLGP